VWTRLVILLLAALGAAVAIGTAVAVVSRNSGGASANASTVYLSPTGNDGNQCTQAKPCLTFGRVWNDSKAGQTIELAAGTYGDQQLGAYMLGAARKPVIFRPARGAKVMVGEVIVKGSYIEFRGMRFGGWSTTEEARGITFRNISSANMFIASSQDIRVIGGDIGPGTGLDYDSQITTTSGGQTPPANILIDGVRFHDWWRPPGTDFHTECLQVGSGINVTIRNSRFERCATHDIFIRSWGQTNGGVHTIRNWTIENNVFGATLDGFFSLNITEGSDELQPCEDILIRNNSFLQDTHVSCPAGGANGIRVESNIQPSMKSFMCGLGGSKWNYNVYGTGTPCGARDRIGNPRFANPAALDLRLRNGSAAIDRGNPKSFPARDFAGQKRPSGRAPDAGAYEKR
jgi:hypothetical protein